MHDSFPEGANIEPPTVVVYLDPKDIFSLPQKQRLQKEVIPF
jgi:hypothetical protein